ncbi:hypothetical protein FI667_g10943, partial [Globisporangium splendens]
MAKPQDDARSFSADGQQTQTHPLAIRECCSESRVTFAIRVKMNKLFFLATAFLVTIGVVNAADAVAEASPALRSLAQVEAARGEINEIPTEKCCL